MFKDKKYFLIKHIMECAICLEEGKLIEFNHNKECGIIKVHDSCLTNWFLVNNNECVICRVNLINDYELLSSEEEIVDNLIIEPVVDINNSENYKLYICKIMSVFLFFMFFLYIIISMTIFNRI